MSRDAALVALLVGGVAAAVAVGFWGYSHDDAFITYRYARSFAEQGELAFNPGERTLGTTAPGYAVLLGALSRVSGLAVPAWGTALSVGSLLAVVLLVQRSLRGATLPLRVGAPLLFGIAALTLRWNVEMLGAEAFVVLALGVAACDLALRARRPVLAGVLVAAAMICRADAALLGGVLGVASWVKERRVPWRFAAAGLLPFLVFLGWLHHEVGAVFPATMTAKQAESAIVRATYSSQEWSWLARTLPLPSRVALLALGAVGVVGAAGIRRTPWMAPVAAIGAWLALHEAAYRALGVPFAPWYHLGLVNALVLLTTVGALSIACRLPRVPGPLALGVGALLLLPVVGPGVAWVRGQYGTPPDPRWSGYAAAGRHIEAQGGRSVAAVEIGFLGWTTRARVLDLMGLVSPQALAARQRGELASLVARERPEYIVDATLFRDPWLRPILANPRVAADYRAVATFPDARGSGLWVRVLHLERDGR